MTFKSVNNPRTFFKYKDCKPGQVLVENGIFVATEDGKFGPNHIFREIPSQEIKVLNSSGHLNYQLDKRVSTGSLCRVIYEGVETLSKGTFAGKPCHQFDVQVDHDAAVAPEHKVAAPSSGTDISL